jgi:RNA recognition motif-containing protein
VLLTTFAFVQPAAKKKQRLDVDGSAAATGADGGSTTIFCGNLPWSATEEQISELFADCGEVTGVRIGKPSLPACSQAW